MSTSETTCTRRNFLRTSAFIGLGLCASSMAPLAAQAAGFSRRGQAVSATRVMLGTIVHISAVHESKDLAEEAVGRSFEEMERLSSIFNRHKADTALSVLNTTGRLAGAPQELLELMDRSLRFHDLSGGAFDVTVAPVVDYLKSRAATGADFVISDAELHERMELVGAQRIALSSNAVHFQRTGMSASLDGIAKGYIVDRASEILSAHGVKNHLINAGGDIRTSGANAQGNPWTIAIEDPALQGNYPDIIRMGTGALATSGGYEIYFDQEKLYHHIVSPTSGKSPHTAVSVSVQAETVVEADALSTAVYLMPVRQGIEFVNSLPGRECLIVGNDGAGHTSRHWGTMIMS